MTPEEFRTAESTWLAAYNASQYLRHLPDEPLIERRRQIAHNMWTTTRDGLVTGLSNQHYRLLLIRRYFETLYEAARRADDSPVSFDERAIRIEASSSYQPPVLDRPIDFDLPCFTKFGGREHIEAAHSGGHLRIAPASSYDDPSLNSAQADRELEHFSRTPNRQLAFRMHGTDLDGNLLPPVTEGLELFEYMMVPDYFVFCCAMGFDYRLFHDFEAESVLVIHDQLEFARRLNDAVGRHVGIAGQQSQELEYYDPYNVDRSQLRAGISKQFSYLYQNEFRFIWRVEPDDAPLSPFMVELGSIEDISSVYLRTDIG